MTKEEKEFFAKALELMAQPQPEFIPVGRKALETIRRLSKPKAQVRVPTPVS